MTDDDVVARGDELLRLCDGPRADLEDALGDALALVRRLRSLPVLPTCGDCGHHCYGQQSYRCGHEHGPKPSREVSLAAPPPSWCPLRGGGR